MPRRPRGVIEEHLWADGVTTSFRLRVPFRGRRPRVELGTNFRGWSRERAQVELDRIMREIARDTWEPPQRQSPEVAVAIDDRDETMHVTVSRFWNRCEPEWAPNTKKDYRWRVDYILRAPWIHEPTATMDIRRVDEFRGQLSQQGLGPSSVNKVLIMLAQVLDDAVDYKLLDVNPARGKRRRMKERRGRKSFLEPDMVIDLIEAAASWEQDVPEWQRYGRAELLTVYILGGPRATELLDATLGDLDLDEGRIRIGEEAGDVKTDAGFRDLELTAFALRAVRRHVDNIRPELRAAFGTELPLFHTFKGGPLNDDNLRGRLLTECARRANKKRAPQNRMRLPERITLHTLRRTFATLALIIGRDLRWVMAQIGHKDPRLVLQLYAQVVQRRRIPYGTVWTLMRFPDEPLQWLDRSGPTAFSPTNRPLVGSGAGIDRSDGMAA